MPINQTPEWYNQKSRFEGAGSVDNKIVELEKLISMTKKHKGVEKLLKQLTTKLAKLKEEQRREKKLKKGSGHSISVPKEGFQVVIIGFANSGKSTFLERMTNAEPRIASFPFTTKKPGIGMMDFEGAQIQLVEVPALGGKRDAELLSIVRSADGIIAIFRNEKDKKRLEKLLDENSIYKKIIYLNWNDKLSEKEIFDFFNLIRIYTKEPGEEPDLKNPMVMKKGSTIMDAAKEIHKDFYKKLKYAKVWGSAKFPGQRAEKNYKLKDEDIVEYHI